MRSPSLLVFCKASLLLVNGHRYRFSNCFFIVKVQSAQKTCDHRQREWNVLLPHSRTGSARFMMPCKPGMPTVGAPLCGDFTVSNGHAKSSPTVVITCV